MTKCNLCGREISWNETFWHLHVYGDYYERCASCMTREDVNREFDELLRSGECLAEQVKNNSVRALVLARHLAQLDEQVAAP